MNQHPHLHLQMNLHLLHTCIAGCGSKHLPGSTPGEPYKRRWAGLCAGGPAPGRGGERSVPFQSGEGTGRRPQQGPAPENRTCAGRPAWRRRACTRPERDHPPPLGSNILNHSPLSDHVEMATGVTQAHAHAPAHAPAPAPHLHYRMWIDTPGRTSGVGCRSTCR
jgi:hypothetical protein